MTNTNNGRDDLRAGPRRTAVTSLTTSLTTGLMTALLAVVAVAQEPAVNTPPVGTPPAAAEPRPDGAQQPAAVAPTPPSGEERLATMRKALELWVQNRRLIGESRNDWAAGKAMLEQRIEVVERQIAAVQVKIEEAEGSIGKTETQKVEMLRQFEGLQQASAALATTLAALEGRTRALLGRLPQPLRDKVRSLSQALPAADSAAPIQITLSKRFQTVVGILDQINKFHRQISVASEVLELGSGQTAEVTTLYLGIAYGYYVTADGKSAGVGTGSAETWQWSAQDESADAIALAIKMFRNEAPARFLGLPIVVD